MYCLADKSNYLQNRKLTDKQPMTDVSSQSKGCRETYQTAYHTVCEVYVSCIQSHFNTVLQNCAVDKYTVFTSINCKELCYFIYFYNITVSTLFLIK